MAQRSLQKGREEDCKNQRNKEFAVRSFLLEMLEAALITWTEHGKLNRHANVDKRKPREPQHDI